MILDGFKKDLTNHRKQPATIHSYITDGDEFFSFLEKNHIPFQEVDTEVVSSFQAHLSHSCKDSQNSIRRKIISIRQLYRFMQKSYPLHHSALDNYPIPARKEIHTAPLSSNELKKLFAIITNSNFPTKSKRDAAILSLLAEEGLKSSELINLKWHNFLYLKGQGSLKVTGAKKRFIEISNNSTNSIKKYLNHLKSDPLLLPFCKNNQKMFISFKGKSSISPIPSLTRHGLKFMLYELGSHLSKPKLNGEILRHHAICHQLSLGKSTEEVMKHLGLKRIGNINQHIQKS